MADEWTEWESIEIGHYAGRIRVETDRDGKAYSLEFEILHIHPDPAQREVHASGFLRWDGCLNVLFNESRDNCLSHFCDIYALTDFSNAIAWVWTKGHLLHGWDGHTEPYPYLVAE